jgi:putative transposase
MDWKQLLAYITGTVDQELLLRNEYLVTENRILRNQLKGHVRLSDGERTALAEIGQQLGKQALKDVATIVKPDTILGWHRKLVAQKFDGSTRPSNNIAVTKCQIGVAPGKSTALCECPR